MDCTLLFTVLSVMFPWCFHCFANGVGFVFSIPLSMGLAFFSLRCLVFIVLSVAVSWVCVLFCLWFWHGFVIGLSIDFAMVEACVVLFCLCVCAFLFSKGIGGRAGYGFLWLSQDVPVVGVGFPLYYAMILNGRAVISFLFLRFSMVVSPFGLLGFAFVGYAFPCAFR